MTRSRWRCWAWPWELRERGVLGMNRRNADYILPANPRAHYPRVDDKLLTKQICQRHGIAVPDTYAVIERQGDIRRAVTSLGERDGFVVKPTRGSGGRGIVVIERRCGDAWITPGGRALSSADMQYHLSTILAGLYSLGGRTDRAVVEQRISRHPVFEQVAVGGTPDIRVILYRGIPAMAMVRLPTEASRGRANLHQGAVAAGINLHNGGTMGGVHHSRGIDLHPDTGNPIAGLVVPDWKPLLEAAIRLAHSLEMGYIGVDFVLDHRRGPLVIEANARPGLAIQLANRTGLLHRLAAIDAQLATIDLGAAAAASPEREWEVIARISQTDRAA